MAEREHFDTIVVGSGFGGSVTAYRHAEAGRHVLLLERGKRYPPGSFARTPREMHENFWDPSEGRLGLFQVWKFSGIDGLVSAGLGGGSLIYANVLIRKDERWFVRRRADGTTTPWPVTRAELDPHYDEVEKVLAPQTFPFDHEPYASTPKTRAFKEAAEAASLDWFLPNLAVSYADPGRDPVPGEPIHDQNGETIDNLHHRTRSTCRLCGECDIGCNYGSKNTLDYNYLSLAEKRAAVLRDRSEVRTLAPEEGGSGYVVGYVEHPDRDEGRPQATSQLPVTEVSCDRLVLAAGTFGTNYLLLKNRDNFPGLSSALGRNFSGNGDFLGLIHESHETVDGKRVPRVLAPSRGSVITSSIRVPDEADGGDGPGFYVQDGGYPDLVDWLVEASDVPGFVARGVQFFRDEVFASLLRSPRADLDEQFENLIGGGFPSASVLPLLGMGLDTAGGAMTLRDGFLKLDWNREDSRVYFDRVQAAMKRVAAELDAKFLPDPISHFHGKLITVHAVGGCAMANDSNDGVVDSYGEVFGYPGFTIADGSVMPGPVGPNPSFTIAALADRFADHQLDRPIA
jgi:cholesterol oxidase